LNKGEKKWEIMQNKSEQMVQSAFCLISTPLVSLITDGTEKKNWCADERAGNRNVRQNKDREKKMVLLIKSRTEKMKDIFIVILYHHQEIMEEK
jgi:hypothetical protein